MLVWLLAFIGIELELLVHVLNFILFYKVQV